MRKKIPSLYLGLLLTLPFLSSCALAKYGINYTQTGEPRYAALYAPKTDGRNPEKLKVVTFNIEFAKRIQAAIKILRTYPQLKNADVIFLQEMDESGTAKIAAALHYNYIYYPAVFHPIPRQDFGNAILSKWPILKDGKIILRDPQKEKKLQRIAAVAVLQIGDKKVFVSSIHMRIKLLPFIRRAQIAEVIQNIPKNISYSIIGGDFNTFHPISLYDTRQEFRDHGFDEATKNIGWTEKIIYTLFKKSSTDHIFSRGLDVKAAGKVVDRKASDHLPVWAEFVLR